MRERLRGRVIRHVRQHKNRRAGQGVSMRFVLLLIVLAFPLIDLYTTIRFARWTGVPVWGWLIMSTIVGIFLLRNERIAFRANTIAAMHGEQPLLRGLVDSGRKVLAGLLFLLPGVLSDLIALVLLALPLNLGREFAPRAAAAGQFGGRGNAIDGEFRRLE